MMLVLARLKSLIVILIIQLVGKKITIGSLNIPYWGLRSEVGVQKLRQIFHNIREKINNSSNNL